jgi:hypothetical protein
MGGAWRWGETKFSWDADARVGKRVGTWEPIGIPESGVGDQAGWRFGYINSYPARWSFSRDHAETRSAALERLAQPAGSEGAGVRMEVAAGWPRLSLRGLLRADVTPTPAGAAPRWHRQGVLAARTKTRAVYDGCRAIPLIPLWGGLVVNTLTFGGGVFLGVTLSTWAKRRMRFGGGRCPACGYELGFDLSSGCPECGWRRAGADSPGP